VDGVCVWVGGWVGGWIYACGFTHVDMLSKDRVKKWCKMKRFAE